MHRRSASLVTTQLSQSRLILTGALAALALLGLAASARAATITPNTLSDEYNVGTSCSLREAVEAANTDAAFGGCTAGSGPDETPRISIRIRRRRRLRA